MIQVLRGREKLKLNCDVMRKNETKHDHKSLINQCWLSKYKYICANSWLGLCDNNNQKKQ